MCFSCSPKIFLKISCIEIMPYEARRHLFFTFKLFTHHRYVCCLCLGRYFVLKIFPIVKYTEGQKDTTKILFEKVGKIIKASLVRCPVHHVYFTENTSFSLKNSRTMKI